MQDDDAFNDDGYEVVRQEFFARVHEPSITFTHRTVSVNTACLKRLPDVDYVQLLINQEERIVKIRPSSEDEKDALAWCALGAKRCPKQIVGPAFIVGVMNMMGWNPDYRYKVLGKFYCSNGRSLFVFDLTMPNIYQRASNDGENPKFARHPTFPKEWENQFGLPVAEHSKRFQVRIFKDHIIFEIKENTP